jgi:hypothetical protein
MKKLLGIVVLSLLVCNNANSEKLVRKSYDYKECLKNLENSKVLGTNHIHYTERNKDIRTSRTLFIYKGELFEFYKRKDSTDVFNIEHEGHCNIYKIKQKK